MARDPEFWFPIDELPPPPRRGRPRVFVTRRLVDYPAPTPQRTPCRLWQGAVDGDGYGQMADYHRGRGHKKYAHRWVWEAVNGPIPKGMVIRHKCDNRVCFRLSHLEIGTVADNNADASERGHLGPARTMPPSMVREIWARRQTGEIWTSIAADYPDYSLATVKRVKDYIACLESDTDSPTDDPACPATERAAGASTAAGAERKLPDGTRVVHHTTPTSTNPGSS